jgi:DNA-binding transcriptional ArsR family regulator
MYWPTGQSAPAEPGQAWAGAADTLKYLLNQSLELDQVFQALADPSRREMVERLSRGPASVSELAEPLPMSLPGVVQHLAVLEESGLVRSEKVGRVRNCRIEANALRRAERWISERRALWERRLDRLGDYLAEQTDPENERSSR